MITPSDLRHMMQSSSPSVPTTEGRPARGARGLRRALTVAAVAAGAALAGGAPANAEPFHSSNLLKTWTPWASTTSQGAQYWTIPAGRAVNMKCWDTGVSREGTSKWFKIQDTAYPFTVGFVPGTVVGNQWTTSPHC